jgi:hypothetical protein
MFNSLAFTLGLVGSVLAKEGSLPDVSSFVSGALKMVFRQLKQEEPAKSASKPRNDTLMAQVLIDIKLLIYVDRLLNLAG